MPHYLVIVVIKNDINLLIDKCFISVKLFYLFFLIFAFFSYHNIHVFVLGIELISIKVSSLLYFISTQKQLLAYVNNIETLESVICVQN